MGSLLALGLFPLVLAAIAAAIGWWIFYSVTKAAIRDGISEARIKVQTSGSGSGPVLTSNQGTAPAGFKWVLVPDESLPDWAQPHKPADFRAD